jgi:hypothetical protein
MCGLLEMTHFSYQQSHQSNNPIFFPPIMCSPKLHFCQVKHISRRKVTVFKLLLQHLHLGINKFTYSDAHQNLAYHIHFILKYFSIQKVEDTFNTKRTVIFLL